MPRYTRIWRNKFLATDAKTLDEMIVCLKSGVAELVEMHNTGKVTMVGGAEEDYATLATTDAAVAERFGFDMDESEED